MASADTPEPLPLYLDCDTGVDDALAIAYLVASGRADLLGVGTVSGNVDAATAARNTLDLLALLDRPDVAVSVGSHDRLTAPYDGVAARVHGGNGIGGVELPRAPGEPTGESAADTLVRLAREHPGRLHVLATGPLTNLALALRAEPSLTTLVAGVTIMGGAALAPGNTTPVAEANIAGDPEAAAEVLGAGWDVTLVPLDVTMDHLLEEAQQQEIASIDQSAMPAIAAMLEHYLGFYERIVGRRAAALHDPLAAAVALGSGGVALAPVVEVVVDTTDGPGRGQTVCDMRGRYAGYPDVPGARCRVVLALEEDFAPLLVETLRCLRRPSLQQDHADACAEREGSAEPAAWEAVTADGLDGRAGEEQGWGERRSRTVTWHDPAAALPVMASTDGLTYLRAMAEGRVPPPPIAGLMVFGATSVEPGEVVFTCTPDESAYNPIGAVHGGLVCTLLDTVLGCAVHTTLPQGTGYTSLEIKVSYLRPVRAGGGVLTATGRATKPGRRAAFADGEVRDDQGRLVATASSTLLVFPL